MKTWDPLTCAYVAGFFDGEGCFSIRVHHPKKKPDASHYLCKICITNTDENMIIWLKETFGGSRHVHHRVLGHKPSHMWSISGNAMVAVIHAIYPYLRSRHRQAQVMLRFRSTFDPKRTSRMEIPEEIKQIRAECIEQLHILNHRGTSSPSALSPSALR